MRCLQCGCNVEESRKFCTNCGSKLENDDAVMRIVEDGPVVTNGLVLRVNKPLKTLPVSEIFRKHKKKAAAVLGAFICLAAVFLIVNLFKPFNKKEYKYDGEFVFLVKDEGGKKDLYLGLPGKKEEKIASDVSASYHFSYLKTSGNSRIYIYFDPDGNLYETDGKGNTERVATNAKEGVVNASPDLKKYLYTAGDKKALYLKGVGKEKIKIDVDVLDYRFLRDNKSVAYRKSNKDLYIWKGNGESKKIGEDTDYYFENSTFDKIAYSTSDKALYLLDLKSGEEKKISSGTDDFFSGFDKKDNIVFWDKDSLYYLGNGQDEPTKMVSDVTFFRLLGEVVVYRDSNQKWYSIKVGTTKPEQLPDMQEPGYMGYFNGYIIYGNQDHALYKAKIGSESSEMLHDNITSIYELEGITYFETTEGARVLYRINKDGSEEKIQENIVCFQVTEGNKPCILSKDNVLSVDGKKYNDVKAFVAAGENTCYLSTKDELYLIEGKSAPKKLCDNINDYADIYYGADIVVPVKGYLRYQQEKY